MNSAVMETKQPKWAFFRWLVGTCPNREQVHTAIICTVVFALAAHLFCWTNTMYGHDSLMVVQDDYSHQISIGRFLMPVYVAFRGEPAAPWLIGVLSIVFLAGANALLVRVLNVTNRAFVGITSGIMATCISVTLCNATYLYQTDLYMLSYLFACLAVYFCYNKKAWGIPAGVVAIVLSLSLYQSYLQVSIVLVMIICFKALMNGKVRQALKLCSIGVVTLLVGLVVYYGVQYLAMQLTGVTISKSYNSLASAFSFGDRSLLSVVLYAWRDPIKYLLFPETHAVAACAVINVVLFCLMAVAMVRVWIKRKAPVSARLLSVLVLALIPLGAGCIHIAAFGSVHALQIHSYFLFYPLVFMTLDECVRADGSNGANDATNRVAAGRPDGSNGAGGLQLPGEAHAAAKHGRKSVQNAAYSIAATALSFCVVASSVVYANQVYLKKDLEYQAAFSTLTRLETDLENLDGYTPGVTPVQVFGGLGFNDTFEGVRAGFPPHADQVFGDPKDRPISDYGVGLWGSISVYSDLHLQQYFDFVLGCPIKIADSEQAKLTAEDVEDVPVFPEKGSVSMRDGIAVVKLSD